LPSRIEEEREIDGLWTNYELYAKQHSVTNLMYFTGLQVNVDSSPDSSTASLSSKSLSDSSKLDPKIFLLFDELT